MFPKEWDQALLGDIAKVSSGGTPDRGEPDYWGGTIPWVTTGEIQFNTITDTIEKITELGLKNSSARIFPKGTLLMAMYGQGKTRGQMAKLAISAATNQACAAIQLKEGYDNEFYYQYLASQYALIREAGNASTQKNLSAGIIKKIVVPIPPLEEQQAISKAIRAWDRSIDVHISQIAKLKIEKRELMRNVFTGKRRVNLSANDDDTIA